MIKKVVLFSIITITTKYASAENIDVETISQNSVAILLTLAVAIIALILAVINTFRISHMRKVSEVEFVNQKDDINVTMEAVKVSLYKEVRNLKKDFNKPNRHQKPKESTNSIKKEVEEETNSEGKKAAEKKPFKRRSSNFKKRPPHKKSTENNLDQEDTKK